MSPLAYGNALVTTIFRLSDITLQLTEYYIIISGSFAAQVSIPHRKNFYTIFTTAHCKHMSRADNEQSAFPMLLLILVLALLGMILRSCDRSHHDPENEPDKLDYYHG